MSAYIFELSGAVFRLVSQIGGLLIFIAVAWYDITFVTSLSKHDIYSVHDKIQIIGNADWCRWNVIF